MITLSHLIDSHKTNGIKGTRIETLKEAGHTITYGYANLNPLITETVESSAQSDRSKGLALWRQCLCVVLAYTMLINPAWLLQATQASVTYGNLAVIRDNVKQYKLASQAGFNPSTDIVRTYARETTFSYNEMHQQTSRTLPDGRTEYKSYDSDGRLIKAVDFAGQVTAYLYEDVNAPSAVSAEKYYGDDGRYPDEPNLVIGYTYDRFGRKVTSEVNDLDADTLAVYKNYYDSQGRLYGLASPQGYIRYTFSDISNRQLDVVTPEASVEDASFYDKVEYGYDQLGRLNTVTVKQRNSQPVNETTAYSYDPAGSLATIDYPNGNTASYTYDNLNRLTRLEHRDTDRIIASYDYTLGADGMRTAAREITYNGSSYDTTNINWTYDAINRLTAEDCNAPSDVNDFEHSYVYDIVGNRLQKIADGNTVTYSYDSLTDELLSEHTPDVNTFYDYDDNGSLVAEYNDICAVRDYSYNLRGRLSSVTAGGVTVSYSYDADGFRVAADNGQTAEHYLVDPFNQTGYSQILKSDDGTNVKFYTIGNDVIAQAKDSQSPQYFAYDGHGSVRFLTDDAGSFISGQKFEYDAYGNRRDNSSAQTNLLYCGEWFDNNAAQYYLRARWYNPSNGRFNRLDPFAGSTQDPQSLHKYLYAHCNPVMFSDPTGEFALLGTFLSVLNVAGIISTAMTIVLKAVRIGLGMMQLVELRDFMLELWRAPIPDLITKLEIRNLVGLLAIKTIGRTLQLTLDIVRIGLMILAFSILCRATLGFLRCMANARALAKAAKIEGPITDPSRLLPSPKMHRGHIFPQEKCFEKYWRKAHIDIDEHTIYIEQATHLRGMHGKGMGKMPGRWNPRWKTFFREHPDASPVQIYQQAGNMMDEFGLSDYEIRPLKDWP
jgi:RHS repeat-associated protein